MADLIEDEDERAARLLDAQAKAVQLFAAVEQPCTERFARRRDEDDGQAGAEVQDLGNPLQENDSVSVCSPRKSVTHDAMAP